MKLLKKKYQVFLLLGLTLMFLIASDETAMAQEPVFAAVAIDGDGEGQLEVGQYTSIAVDKNDRPHISYYDVTNGDLKYAGMQTDRTWKIKTVDDAGDVGLYTSLFLNTPSYPIEPYISYYYKTNWYMKVVRYDGGAWTKFPVHSGRIGVCEATGVAVVDGKVNFVYFDADSGELRLVTEDGPGGWTPLPITVHSGWLWDLSLVLSSQDKLCLAYIDGGPLSQDLRFAQKTNGTWNYSAFNPVDESYGIDSVSLAMDSQGKAHIAYTEGSLFKYVKGSLNDNVWIEEESETFDDCGGPHCSIAVGSDGVVHIAYYTSSAKLGYAWKEAGVWRNTTADDGIDVGQYNSIAVDSEGHPHISYYDEFNGDLKYAYVRTGEAVDIALVLDMSGSMLSEACTGCDPKFDLLKQAVELFCSVWRGITLTDDHIGAVYFRTNVSGYNDGTLYPVVTHADSIAGDVKIQTTVSSNLTAMGGGLQKAIDKLEDEPGQRHIILFTDGMQNVNPKVVKDSNGELSIGSNAGATKLDENLEIKISTIGVGAYDPYLSLLIDIANATNGTPKATYNLDPDIRRFYVENLVWAMQNNSPQLIDYRNGSLSYPNSGPGVASETFTVNHSAKKVLLKLSWKTGHTLDFNVWKDGHDLTKEGHIITGSFYQIYVVDVPVSVAGQVINPGGDWSMAISGDAGASFEAAAIVDDSTFKYNAILDLPAYVTGEAINLNVQVTAGDQPISGAHVTAEFIHPTQSMGTLLSIMPTLIPPPDFVPEPNSPPGQAKLDVLQRYFNVADLLQPRSTTLDLYELDEGAYSSVPFMDTTVPGLYKVVVHISGDHPDVGPFHRTQTLCTMVLFDQVDRDASDLRVTEAEVIPGGMNLQLYIRPVDRFGNLLGPDYPDQIQVALSVGEVQGSPQDNVDGSYRIPLWIPEKTDPQIRIVIKGNTVYGGLLSKLDSSDAF